MKNRSVIIILFFVMAAVQWLIPINMIWDSERTLASGREYKFRLAPVDPEDPFRGRYLNLDFDISRVTVATPPYWEEGEKVFVVLEQDEEGFARINRLAKNKPSGEEDYIKSMVRSAYGEDSLMVFIEYPLDRYYINEKMADPIQEMLDANQLDPTKINYALVRVRTGGAVLEEVYLDEVSVTEWVRRERAEE